RRAGVGEGQLRGAWKCGDSPGCPDHGPGSEDAQDLSGDSRIWPTRSRTDPTLDQAGYIQRAGLFAGTVAAPLSNFSGDRENLSVCRRMSWHRAVKLNSAAAERVAGLIHATHIIQRKSSCIL